MNDNPHPDRLCANCGAIKPCVSWEACSQLCASIAKELAEALSYAGKRCCELHHDKKDRHGSIEDPVEAQIKAAESAYREWVPADFARQLETELAQAQAIAKGLAEAAAEARGLKPEPLSVETKPRRAVVISQEAYDALMAAESAYREWVDGRQITPATPQTPVMSPEIATDKSSAPNP